jgi:hypothetical protein
MIEIDNDGDGYNEDEDCDDNDPDVNPGQEEIPYNGKDDDCNPETPDEPIFSITTDQHEYELGETAHMTINAPDQASVNIEICGPYNGGWVQCYSPIDLENEDYPVTLTMPYTNRSGAYIIEGIMNYNETTRYYNTSYLITNNIGITIDGSTSVKEGEIIELEVSASGGIGTLNYTWTLENGTKIYTQEIEILYNEEGDYTTKLDVMDEAENNRTTTFTIDVEEAFDITIQILDSTRNTAIENTEITIEEEVEFTNNDGEAKFILTKGKHDVVIYKEGYGTTNRKITVNKTEKFTIKLNARDEQSPEITLKAPADKEELISKTVSFRYSVNDLSSTNCTLYLAEISEEWYQQKGTQTVNDNSDKEFNELLEEKEYKWKIECQDAKGHKKTSEERTFTIIKEIDDEFIYYQDRTVREYLEDALDAIAGFSLQQKEASDILGYEQQIKLAMKTYDQSVRDVNDILIRRDLTDEEKTQKQEEFRTRVRNIISTIPVSLEITNSKVYVKYPKKEEVENITRQLIEFYDIKEKQKQLIERTNDMQKGFIVSTKTKNIKLTYIDGTTKEITLVAKDIEYGNLSTEKQAVLEQIPKNIATTASEINFLTEMEVIKEDPLIRFKTEERIAYYLNKTINLDEIEKTNTILADDNLNRAMLTVTGGSILDFDIKSASWLLILVIVIALFYILHSFDVLNLVGKLLKGTTDTKQLNYVSVLMNDVNDYLEAKNTDKALFVYREITLEYEKLSAHAKAQMHDKLVNLCANLDLSYIREIVGKIQRLIQKEKYGEAKKEYQKLEGTYNRLPDKDKEDVYIELEGIANTLNAK